MLNQADDRRGGATQPLPAAGPIARACRAATAHNYGNTLAAAPVVTATGVRVRMSSWPRQQEALRALRALGYQAAEDLKGGEYGAALLVTGWDVALLMARAERLERAVAGFERDLPTWADEAITRFTDLQDTGGPDDAAACEQVIADTRMAAREQPGPGYLHVSAPVDERDRVRASEQVRELLDRVAAGETAVARMTEAAGRLAETAIGLFLDYRGQHGCDDQDAAAKAVRDIGQYAWSIHDLAGWELEAADARSVAGALERKDSNSDAD